MTSSSFTPGPRHRVTAARLADLSGRLGEREREIIKTLARVRVATARQLQRLYFTDSSPRSNARTAQRTLQRLTNLRVVTRLDRAPGGRGGGSAGHVYALDVAGLRLANPRSPLMTRRPWPVSQMFLAHALEVTDWYVRLVEDQRAGGVEVVEFVAEPRTWRHYVSQHGSRATLKPDAFIRLARNEWEEHWFLEVDRDTEHTPALRRQLDQYIAYWRSGEEQAKTEVFPRVLWVVPNMHRHAELIDVIGRLPAETWSLFQVAMSDDALTMMTRGQSP
jgi:protein involved in plasmid replication-relaxation